MAANLMWDVPLLTPQQASPFAAALGRMQKLREQNASIQSQQLANQKSQELMKFVTPEAQAALQEHLIKNQYNQTINQYQPQDIQTTLAIKAAERKQKEAQAAMEAEKAKHPSWYAPGPLQLYEYAKEQGQDQAAQPQTQSSYGGPMSLVGGGQFTPPQGQPQQQLATGIIQQNQQQDQQNIANPMAKYSSMSGPQLKLKLATDPAFAQQYESDKTQFEAKTSYAIKQEQDAIQNEKDLNETQQNLNAFVPSYQKSTFKGVSHFGVGGNKQPDDWTSYFPGMGLGHDWTEEQKADIASNNFQASLIPIFKNKMTEKEFGWLKNVKLNRELEKGAMQSIADKTQAAIDRGREWNKFQRDAKAQGFTDPYAIENMYLNYIHDRPAIDDKGNVDYKNIGTAKDYLNPANYNAALKGQPYEIIRWDDIKHSAKVNKKSTSDVIFDMVQEGRITKDQAREFIRKRK